MMKKHNIGRDFAIKEAFAKHLLKAVDEIIPVTRELRALMQRERAYRVAICADRMVDDASKLLEKYNQEVKNGQYGIHSPLPIILIAFAKENQPISVDRGLALPNPKPAQLGDKNSQWYLMRADHIEKRVQIAFFAHTSESAKALTSQIRLYLQKYGNYRFPVTWHFGGYDFDLTASFQEIPITDDVADLPERTNLTVLLWNLTVQCQIPYLKAPEPHQYITDEHGNQVIKGYGINQSLNLSQTNVSSS